MIFSVRHHNQRGEYACHLSFSEEEELQWKEFTLLSSSHYEAFLSLTGRPWNSVSRQTSSEIRELKSFITGIHGLVDRLMWMEDWVWFVQLFLEKKIHKNDLSMEAKYSMEMVLSPDHGITGSSEIWPCATSGTKHLAQNHLYTPALFMAY